jgi:4-amino-4-deoxy-L-arabinose transferase-like glycosyltransferase
LTSAVFGALDALMIYLLCRAMFPGWEIAFASALVFLTTHEVLHWIRGVHLEAMVTFWILVGLYAAYRSVKTPAATIGIGVAAGLGWLAKGPHSLYPAIVALAVWKTEGVLWRRIFSLWTWAAAAVLLAILAPWFWLRMSEGAAFTQDYVFHEMGHTLFGPTQLRNGPLFYPARIGMTYWPWLPAAVAGFVLLARGWRKSIGARFWLIFAAVAVIAVEVTAERRMRYLFQVYPAFSVASGAAVAWAVQSQPRLLRIFVLLAAIGSVVLLWAGRKASPPVGETRDVILVAREIKSDEIVWITRSTQFPGRKDPSVAKILGFYALPLLSTCAADCAAEAKTGVTVIARTGEAERVAQATRGVISYSNPTLSIVRIP